MPQTIKLSKGTCDVIKLMAAFLVLTSHMASTAIITPGYDAKHWIFYLTASQNGYIGVALFFFLSGYGLMQSELKCHLGFKEFFRRRFLKIYLPVILITAMWLPIFYLTQELPPPQTTNYQPFIKIGYYLFYNFADPVMWYVRVLFVLYAAFFVASLPALAGKRNYGVLLLLAGTIIYTILSVWLHDSIRDHSVALFGLGAFISYYKDKGLGFFLIIMTIVGLICSATAFFTSHPLTGFIHCIFDYFLVAIVVTLICCKNIEWRLSSALTLITFDIYLIHFKVLMVESKFVDLWIMLLSVIPLSILISWLFLRLRTKIIKI